MASILDRYGIKEVADCTFYTINPANGEPLVPVLYLDTLKVSTIEQTADVAYATGGKGNANLIAWDFGKEITVTLEDALFSAKSMSIMFGTGRVDTSTTKKLWKTIQFNSGTAGTAPTQWEDATTGAMQTIGAGSTVFEADGTTAPSTLDPDTNYLMMFQFTPKTTQTIEISANSFPGTYFITGDTFARRETDGVDEYFQFIVYKGKVVSENTITLEAEGDPSVFSMSVNVLRAEGGKMMDLLQYSL